ncbi:glycosyltransferase [Roseateles sp. L2-2]|uniref:glycosyltransferase n=1 Tax=Roseateles TaxID=93681 RepID=UPI003D35C8CE
MDRPAQRRPGATPTLSAVTTGNPVPSLHIVEIVGAVSSDEAPDEACPLATAADRLGATRLVERLVERHGKGGNVRFTVVCPADGPYAERLRDLGADTVIVAMPDDPPWHAIQVLIGLIRNKQAAVLHAHLPNAHRLAGLAGGITRTPVLATVQGAQMDMPDLEVHRLIASQLSVVTEASYFHALGLGLSPDRITLDSFDPEADDESTAQSLDAIGQRLRLLATPAESRGAAQARSLAQPLAQDIIVPPANASTPPVAILAVLDELEPSPARASGFKS